MITREFSLYLTAGYELPVVINVNQYDRGEQWLFTLYESKDLKYIPSSGSIIGIKADGKLISNTATVNANGQVVIAETEQMTAVAGKSTYELLIDDSTHGTANFYVQVEESPADKGVLSESDLSLIREALDNVSETIIKEAVQDWMDENLVGGEVVVDKTLTMDGAAADSLAVGNALMERVSDGYVEEGVAYFTNGEETLFTITGIGGGGGGSGGGGGNNAVITVTNTTGWISKSVSASDEVIVSLTWASIESEMSTGAGTMTVKVNGVTKIIQAVDQGSVSADVTRFLSIGNNSVRVTISDVYNNSKTLSFSVNVLLLSLTSSFDEAIVRTGSFDFPYTATGNVAKHVMFFVDGTLIGYEDVITSGRQNLFAIPAQTHGAHIIEAYFTAEINGETVESNHLIFSAMCTVSGNTAIIISSPFSQTASVQYETISIPYYVYDPETITADVTLEINGTVISELSDVGRTLQTWTYRADTIGEKLFTITATDGIKTSSKTFTVTVTQGEIDVYPETSSLALYLTSSGRTNAETHPETWSFGNISAILSNFNFVSDGWVLDGEGHSVLRVTGDARVTIPYQIFGLGDFRTTGKTIEFDFSTSNVSDYNDPVITCWSGGRGLKITSQNAILKSENTEISTLYKDNEHVRLTFVVEKRSEDRVVYCYINGIMSGAVQYIADDDFSQTSPVGITIGSNYATVDIYDIRIYDNDLTRNQVLTNWIADTRDIDVMLQRYNHNNVYDAYGQITTETLPTDLPYFILEAPELPQYKGDKKTISGTYTDPVDASKSFSFTGCQINVQGTSSAPYYRKNYDMQFKEGFEMTSTGEFTSSYAIRTGSIPFNRFVLKADVASSESTNNTGLVMFYNTTCPYKIPEMVEDPRVRWGIEGVPIVVFWYNPTTGITEFMGKYNFNLPKRAPTPYGYDPANSNDESWEWQRNNSANVKFQDNDFTTQAWDAVAQQYYPEWQDDFEARFPDDSWTNTAKLEEFLTWVKSTWRNSATNANLPQNITYRVNTTITVDSYPDDESYTIETEMDNGVATGYKNITFTKDTPAYRLTKFRAELADYAEIDSAVFYYLFTEIFLMIDSRAKNMFVGFHGGSTNDISRAMDRKVVFEPYDMDTAIGTNNSGVLMFGYYLEDTDTVSSVISGGDSGSSNAPVFNAQDSVFWTNLRDAFRPEITTMYRNLRASTWSYNAVETMYENHQSKWCEAIFNEDAYVKYLVPLVNPVTVDDATGELIKTDRYLTMLQGSKTEQRKWWLRNRFRYMDSKFVTGDAQSTIISLRVFNSGTFSLTPATDLYVGVSFGGGTTVQLERTTAGVPKSFTYTPQTGVTEMETWLYSGDLLTDVGDLSVFYPNEIDFSKARRLERLQLGSTRAGYSNANLRVIDVTNCSLLKYIDCRNCPNLSQAINLSNCVSIEEAYFEGTSITGVSLPNGGIMKTLHLPSTVKSLIVKNQPLLTDIAIVDENGNPDASQLTTLVLENVSTAFNSYLLAKEMAIGSRARLIGIDWTIEDANDIVDLLKTLRGVDENGNNTEEAQLTGHIHFSKIREWQLANLTNRYPYLTITYTTLYKNLFWIWNKCDDNKPYMGDQIFEGVKRFPANSPSISSSWPNSGKAYFYFPDMYDFIGGQLLYRKNHVFYIGYGKDGDTDVITLNAASYANGSGSNFYIYVPDDLVEDYKGATNWSTMADHIYPLSEFTALESFNTWGSNS